MCGIVGYIGKNQAAPILLEGLSKLEYRGYDSAGIAVYNNNELEKNMANRKFSAFCLPFALYNFNYILKNET